MPVYSAQDIVKRAMRTIGVLEAEESPTAAEQEDGLENLNDILHSWRTRGIGSDHVDVEASTEMLLDSDEYRAIRYSLAMDLIPEYGCPQDRAAMIAAAKDGAMRIIEAKYCRPKDLCVDAALQQDAGSYNIYTG